MMNNRIKTVLGGIILGLMASGLYLVLPGGPLRHFAYAATLTAVVMAVLSALILTHRNVSLPQDVVFPLAAWTYLATSLLLSAAVLGLDAGGIWSAPWPLFSVAHALLLSFFTLRILTFTAGKEHIDRIEETVALKLTDWRLLLADLDAMKNLIPTGLANREQASRDVQGVCEAFRYSDPMSKPALAELEVAVKSELRVLSSTVAVGSADEISACCAKVLQRLKDRNTRVKALKQG